MNTPVKNIPDPDRPEIKFPDPTRSENIFKNVPRPRIGGSVSVRSGPVRGNSGFRVAPQVFSTFNIPVYHEAQPLKNGRISFKTATVDKHLVCAVDALNNPCTCRNTYQMISGNLPGGCCSTHVDRQSPRIAILT